MTVKFHYPFFMARSFQKQVIATAVSDFLYSARRKLETIQCRKMESPLLKWLLSIICTFLWSLHMAANELIQILLITISLLFTNIFSFSSFLIFFILFSLFCTKEFITDCILERKCWRIDLPKLWCQQKQHKKWLKQFGHLVDYGTRFSYCSQILWNSREIAWIIVIGFSSPVGYYWWHSLAFYRAYFEFTIFKKSSLYHAC